MLVIYQPYNLIYPIKLDIKPVVPGSELIADW